MRHIVVAKNMQIADMVARELSSRGIPIRRTSDVLTHRSAAEHKLRGLRSEDLTLHVYYAGHSEETQSEVKWRLNFSRELAIHEEFGATVIHYDEHKLFGVERP
jgi:GrpB-like predicted nucleotidyltransferase (UPF0157 family)